MQHAYLRPVSPAEKGAAFLRISRSSRSLRFSFSSSRRRARSSLVRPDLRPAELARSLGRAPSEGSLRNALAALKAGGKLEDRHHRRQPQWRLTLTYARQLMAERER
jgi:hypothetical protein